MSQGSQCAAQKRYRVSESAPKLSRGMQEPAPSRSVLYFPRVTYVGVITMKTLLSTLALTLALGFTVPAFAGDVTQAKNAADCEKAGGTWDAATNACSEKKM
jgi:hypothetical protein